MNSISLISNRLKRDVQLAFWARALLTWGICTAVVCVIGLLLLFPSWYHLRSAQLVKESAISPEETALKKNIEDGKRELDTFKLLLKSLEQSRDVDVALLFSRFRSIADAHAGEVAVARYSFSADTGKRVLSVSGTSASRDALVSFVRDIQKEGGVSGVELPVADLAGRNGTFPFTITGTVIEQTP